jgi:hypothetical protein
LLSGHALAPRTIPGIPKSPGHLLIGNFILLKSFHFFRRPHLQVREDHGGGSLQRRKCGHRVRDRGGPSGEELQVEIQQLGGNPRRSRRAIRQNQQRDPERVAIHSGLRTGLRLFVLLGHQLRRPPGQPLRVPSRRRRLVSPHQY